MTTTTTPTQPVSDRARSLLRSQNLKLIGVLALIAIVITIVNNWLQYSRAQTPESVNQGAGRNIGEVGLVAVPSGMRGEKWLPSVGSRSACTW